MPFDYVTVSARRTSGVLDKEFAVVPDVKDAAIVDFGDFDAHAPRSERSWRGASSCRALDTVTYFRGERLSNATTCAAAAGARVAG